MDDLLEQLRLLPALWERLAAEGPAAVGEQLAAAPHLLLWGAGVSAFLCGSLLLTVRWRWAARPTTRAPVAPLHGRERGPGRPATTVSGAVVGAGMLLLYALTLAWHAAPARLRQLSGMVPLVVRGPTRRRRRG
jgi:hypothetical protein